VEGYHLRRGGCFYIFNGCPEIITEKTGIKDEILTDSNGESSG
jgi:hypothetical protein